MRGALGYLSRAQNFIIGWYFSIFRPSYGPALITIIQQKQMKNNSAKRNHDVSLLTVPLGNGLEKKKVPP